MRGQLVWIAPDPKVRSTILRAVVRINANDGFAFGGQTVLTLEGVFFTPRAQVDYTGTGRQKQADAQFVALRLDVNGQGQLRHPARHPDASVEFPIDPTSGLIR